MQLSKAPRRSRQWNRRIHPNSTPPQVTKSHQKAFNDETTFCILLCSCSSIGLRRWFLIIITSFNTSKLPLLPLKLRPLPVANIWISQSHSWSVWIMIHRLFDTNSLHYTLSITQTLGLKCNNKSGVEETGSKQTMFEL